MSLSQSLAKLLEKMGGGAPDAPAGGEEAILAEIAETYDPESGIELPKVTTDDNGKVLKVISGSWNKADLNALPAVSATDNGKLLGVSNGAWEKVDSSIYWVALSYTGTSNHYSTDKTTAEIVQAFYSDKQVIFKLLLNDSTLRRNFVLFNVEVDGEGAIASAQATSRGYEFNQNWVYRLDWSPESEDWILNKT